MINKLEPLTKMDPATMTCMDVVKCLHNLSDTDLKILTNLPIEGGLTAQMIGESIGKDRSTAHRGLEKMVACGLVFKEKRSGNPRGYSNYYYRVPTRELYRMTERSLDKCYSRVKEALNDLDGLE